MVKDRRTTELEAELMDLYEALDERDRQIEGLENEVANNGEVDDGTTQEDRNNILASDLEVCQNEVMQCRDTIAELRAQLEQSHIENESLWQDKRQLEDQVNSHKSLLESQKQRLATATRLSQDAKKERKDGTTHQYRLELENQNLRATVEELEENEEDLITEIETLAKEKSESDQKCKDISAKHDTVQAELDEKMREYVEVNREKVELQDHLESELHMQQRMKEEMEQMIEAQKRELSRINEELEEERRKSEAFESRVASSMGAKRRRDLEIHVGELQGEISRLNGDLQSCRDEKDQLERDLDSACRALEDSKHANLVSISKAVGKERLAVRRVEAQLEASQRRESELRSRCSDLEEQKEELGTRLCHSEERNSWYEDGHGLTDAVRYQKKLEADIRRRDYDLKRLSIDLGKEVDKFKVLSKACDWLKENAGLAKDCEIDDDEIRAALLCDENRLESQNAELSRQIDALESDRLKLLKQLRENAAQIGDKGVRFLGLNASQVMQVTEFASNLREGRVDLPLNDRSMELTSELSAVRAEREADKLTIERLEREIFGLRETSKGAFDDAHLESELSVVRQALDDIQGQNQRLRDQIESLSDERKAEAEAADRDDTGVTVLTPFMRERAEEILGESLVDMPPTAQVQLMCVVKEHDNVKRENSVLNASLGRWSKQQKHLRPRQSLGASEYAMASGEGGSVDDDSDGAGNDHGVYPSEANNSGSIAPVDTGMAQFSLAGGRDDNDDNRDDNDDVAAGDADRHGGEKPVATKGRGGSDKDGDLVKCLEALSAKERILEEQEELLHRCEASLSSLRKKVAIQRDGRADAAVETGRRTEEELKTELEEAVTERDQLRILIRRRRETDEALARAVTGGYDGSVDSAPADGSPSTRAAVDDGNDNALQTRFREACNRSAIHEANEMKLKRRCNGLSCRLQCEAEARGRVERRLVEAESRAGQRILYLERWKLDAISSMERLHRSLDDAVSPSTHRGVVRELADLRECHVLLLQKEVDWQIGLTSYREAARNAKALKEKCDELEEQLGEQEQAAQRKRAAASDGETRQPAVAGDETCQENGKEENTNAAALVNRMEDELGRAQLRVRNAEQRNRDLAKENESLWERIRSSDEREVATRKLLEDNKKMRQEVQSLYDGGLTAIQSIELRQTNDHLMEELRACKSEADRFKQMAELASSQAGALETMRTSYVDALQKMQDSIAENDTESDDAATIGRLKCQLLMAEQSKIDSEVRAEKLQSCIRDKDKELSSLETRFDKHIETSLEHQARCRIQLSAMQGALQRLVLRRTGTETYDGVADFDALAGNSASTDFVGLLRDKISRLSMVTERQHVELEAAKHVKYSLQFLNEAKKNVENLFECMKQEIGKSAMVSSEKQRCLSLVEEVRISKFECMEEKGKYQSISNTCLHLKETVKKLESRIMEMEEERITAETKHILASSEDGAFVRQILQPTIETKNAEMQTDQWSGNLENQLEEANDKVNQVTKDAVACKARVGELQEAHSDALREIDAIKETAQKSISHLKVLLDGKDRTIEEYKCKLAEARHDSEATAGFDDKSDSVQLSVQELRDAIAQLEGPASNQEQMTGRGESTHQTLVDHMNEATQLLQRKEQEISRLESKLSELEQHKQLSEKRCAEAFEEMKNMKLDMVSLADGLKDADRRAQDAHNKAAEAIRNNKQTLELQDQLSQKEEKLSKLQNAVKNLKAALKKEKKAQTSTETTSDASEEKLKGLMNEIFATKRALAAKRQALVVSRSKANSFFDEITTLEQQVVIYKQKAKEEAEKKHKAQQASSQAMKKLQRMKMTPHSLATAEEKKLGDRVKELEGRVQSLMGQNASLRSSLARSKLRASEDKENQQHKRNQKQCQGTGRELHSICAECKALKREISFLKGQLSHRGTNKAFEELSPRREFFFSKPENARLESARIHDELVDELQLERKKNRDLERDALEAEATIKALRYDVKNNVAELLRCRRKVEKLDSTYNAMKEAESNRRAENIADLEKTIGSLRKDVQKLAEENEILRSKMEDEKNDRAKENHEVMASLQDSKGESDDRRRHLSDLKEQRSIQREEAEQVHCCPNGADFSREAFRSENIKLKKENERLTEELQAFDLDFFEEIEDLKLKYNDAVLRLTQYEDSS